MDEVTEKPCIEVLIYISYMIDFSQAQEEAQKEAMKQIKKH
jgi:hypothetical protein